MISSVFTVLTGEEWPLDIVKSQTPKPEPHYSFLSIVFGIVADVDIESERFRYMGDIRFSIMAMMKIIVKNTFSGKLCYLPVEDASVDGNSKCNSHCGETVQLSDGTSKCEEESGEEQRNLKDGKLEDGNLKNGRLINGILNDGTVDESKSSSDETSNVKDKKLDDGIVEDGESIDGNLKDGKLDDSKMDDGKLDDGIVSDDILGNGSLATGIPNNVMPNFHEPIPESWTVVEGDFVGWIFVSTTHIGKDMFCAPDGFFGDGVIHCMCLNGDISRTDLLNVLSKMEAGDHVGVHGVHMLKARAFRFEPYSTPSEIITIDGERFEWEKLQAEVFKGLGRVRCRGPPKSPNEDYEE